LNAVGGYMDIISYKKLLFCLLLLIWTIHSIEQGDESDLSDDRNLFMPRFYHLGESQPPTEKILSNLTYYREQWEKIKNEGLEDEEAFGETYSFTFSWDCSPCPDECLSANKFIIVEDDAITSIEISNLNDDKKTSACLQSDDATNTLDYKTIDELYDILISWISTALSSNSVLLKQYRIIELMLEREFLFPMAVRLSNGSDYIQWEIPCFEPHKLEDEYEVCDYDSSTYESEKQWTFWITKEMQSFLGWSMIFLILVACSLGYCINWLKKKKSEKIEAWREKEEKQREEKERQRAEKSKKKKKSKRKGSKVKYKEKRRKSNKDKPDINKNEYSSLQQANVDDDDNSTDEDHYDIIEEQKDDE